MKLRELKENETFTYADDPGEGLHRVLDPAVPGKDRVTVEALSTGMYLRPTMVVGGHEDVNLCSYREDV